MKHTSISKRFCTTSATVTYISIIYKINTLFISHISDFFIVIQATYNFTIV